MEIIRQRRPLDRLIAAMRENRLTIGFMGGSITAGDANSGGMESNWPLFIQNWFLSDYPALRLKICNAASGGTDSLSGLMRMDRDILRYDCDLVFVEYAVNDYYEDPAMAEERFFAEEGLIRKLRKAGCDVVLVYTYRRQMHRDMMSGRVPPIIRQLEELAEHYGLSSVWSGLHALNQLNRGRITFESWLPIAGQTLHPDYYGSMIYAEPVIELLGSELERENKGAPLKAVLPPPLKAKQYENIKSISFSDCDFAAPWCVQRELKIPWFDEVLCTCADGASLRFRFSGRALMISVNFGKRCGYIEYSIDGGAWKRVSIPRADWVPVKDWSTAVLLEKDLPLAEHSVVLRSVFENDDNCLGSECKINSIMYVD